MLELLMDPLGALVVTFFVMGIISIAGVVLMYLLKNEKLQKAFLYALSMWGVVVAYCGVLSTGGFISESLMSILFGVLGVGGILIQMFSKKENKFQIARIMVTISVVAGMIDYFLI